MSKKRIIWLDYARFFAICSVLLVHSSEYAYSMGSEKILKLGLFSSVVRLAAIVIGRLGVPVFLMLSGYLLLDRDYSDTDKIKIFYKRNLLPLVLTTEIWVVIYEIYQITVGRQEFVLLDFIKDLLFVKDNDFGHFWYMPMIIGLYIALPFVSNAVKNIDLKVLAVPLAVLCLTVFGIRTISIFDKTFGWELDLIKKIFTDFSGGAYGAYVLLGYFVKKNAFKKIKAWILWAAMLVSGVLTGYTLMYSLRRGNDYHLWYDYAGVLICSLCLFELFSRINGENKIIRFFGRFVTSVSVLSLGMYFIHKPVLSFIRYRILNYGFYRPVNLVLFFIIIFAVSYILALIISKIPKVRKVLILVKD